jgi:hypothetical protein
MGKKLNTLPVKANLLEDIIDKIQGSANLLKHLNKIEMFDYNRMIEDYVLGILNITYSMDFINLNDEKKNFPALDLGDRKKRVGVQITTNNDRSKIIETLEKFFKHELDKDFDCVWILIFGDKKNYKPFNVKEGFEFIVEKHVIDIVDLEQEISGKDEDTLYALKEYLNKKHGYFVSQESMLITDKMSKQVCENFIHRKWIPSQYLNSTNKKIEDYYLWPKEILINNNKIVLVCDAGFGKTEEAYNITNFIGKEYMLKFPFFCDLSTFDSAVLEYMIREIYPNIPLENIVLILDGFDELGDKELTFRRQLEALINLNPSISVILTSRSSHFDGEETSTGGTFEGFATFHLTSFSDEQIYQYLDNRKVNSESFFYNVISRGYSEHIRNAFFMVHLVDLFIDENVLPEGSVLFDKLIEKSVVHDKTHFRTVIHRDKYDDVEEYLMVLGFISYAIDKRGFSKKHLKAIFADNDAEKILKHVAIWHKVGNNRWYFIHNNFAEYLAAKFLSVLSFKDYKDIISTGDNQQLLIPRWEQVINFLISTSQDKELISWIIENNLRLLGKAEIHHLDDSTKKRLFLKYFTEYENKRILMRYDVVKNIVNASLICFPSQIQYLIEVIDEDRHFTTIHNSISMLESCKDLLGMEEQVRVVLSGLINSNSYRNYEKKDAVSALADHKLLTKVSLLQFIQINAGTEDQYLRTGFFYAIWTLELSDAMVDYLVDSYDKVNYRSGHETYLVDQHINYEKAIGQFKKIDSIKKGIKKVEETADRFESASNLVNGLIIAIKELNDNEENVSDLIFKLYFISSKELDLSLEAVIKLIEELKLGKDFIAYMLKEDNRRIIHQLDRMIDNSAADYIVSWYQSELYDYEDAKEIILSLSLKNPYAVKIFNAHKLKTGEDRIAQLTGFEERNQVNNKATERIQKVIFDKDEAEKAIGSFLDKHTAGKPVIVEEIIEDKKIHRDEYSEFERLLLNLIVKFFNKDTLVVPNLTDIEDRDSFVLWVQFYKHKRGRGYKLQGSNLIELKRICKEKVSKYKDKSFVSIIDGEYKGIFNEAIYTSYFLYVYDFEYPIYYLQKMLLIDRRYYDDPKDFYKVLNRLSTEQARDYIQDNIRNGYVHGDTLKYHVDFCLEHKLNGLLEPMEQYLEFDGDEIVGIKAAVDYILNVKGVSYFMENHYAKIQENLLSEVDIMVSKKDPKALVEIMKNKFKVAEEDHQGFYALKVLIRCNDANGLEEYLNWIMKNKKSYWEKNSHLTINGFVGSFRNISGILILAEMCALMLCDEYSDHEFDNLYRNATSALKSIAVESVKSAKCVYDGVTQIMLQYKDVKDIGFMNHILDEAKELTIEIQSTPVSFCDALVTYKLLREKREKLYLEIDE